MAIPFAHLQGGTVSVAPAPALSPVHQPDQTGAALMQGGEWLARGAQLVDRIAEAREAREISDALVDVSSRLDLYRGELDQDPDYKTRAQKFAARREELRAETAGRLSSGRARDDFNTRYNRLAGSMQLQVQHAARDEELQQFKLGLAERLDALATRAVMARTVQEREVIQAEAKQAIEDAVTTRSMKATAAWQLHRAYLGKVDASLAAEMVRLAPGAAIQALGNPEAFKYLDASRRVELRAQAQGRLESLGVQQRAETRAAIQDYIAARQSGQPVTEETYGEVLRMAGGEKTPLGRQLTTARRFYDQVEVNTSTQSLPQLRANLDRLEKGAGEGGAKEKLFDLSVARAVRREIDAQEKEQRREFGQLFKDFDQVRGAGEGKFQRYEDLLRLARDLDPSGGLAGVVQEKSALYDRLQTASGESAVQVRARIAQLDALRGPDGALDADRVAERGALIAATERKEKESREDPAAYALRYYRTIGESFADADRMAKSGDATLAEGAQEIRRRGWQAMIDAQRREGIPEHRIALLTRGQAEELRARLQTADGQARADLIEGLRAEYGGEWSRVQAQLWNGKPPPADLAVLGAIPPGNGLPKVLIAEAFKVTDQQAKEVLGPKVLADIDQTVRGQVTDLAATMAQAPDGPAFVAMFQGAIEKVARLHVMRGESVTAATKRAAEQVFYDYWEPVGTVRVPKVAGQPIVEASAVRRLQAEVVNQLGKLDVDVPTPARGTTEAQAREALVRNVKSFGYWMTTADDQGMVLMAGPGLPVMLRNEKGAPSPLVVPFDSVLAFAGHRQAARNLSRRYDPEGYPTDLGRDDGPPAATVPRWMRYMNFDLGGITVTP